MYAEFTSEHIDLNGVHPLANVEILLNDEETCISSADHSYENGDFNGQIDTEHLQANVEVLINEEDPVT